MLAHISFGVLDLSRSRGFYDPAMAALGYQRVWDRPGSIGYGEPGGEDVLTLNLHGDRAAAPGPGFHLALIAPSRAAVDAFHAAALANGGQDAGPPGLRPQYGPAYYAAFVCDPDGVKLEAFVREGS